MRSFHCSLLYLVHPERTLPAIVFQMQVTTKWRSLSVLHTHTPSHHSPVTLRPPPPPPSLPFTELPPQEQHRQKVWRGGKADSSVSSEKGKIKGMWLNVCVRVWERKWENKRANELRGSARHKKVRERSSCQAVCLCDSFCERTARLQLCSTTPLSKQRYLLPKHSYTRTSCCSFPDWLDCCGENWGNSL